VAYAHETLDFPQLEHPIVAAPLAGGPSTPELAAAVSQAGGLGFVAAGYLTADALSRQIDDVRRRTEKQFGVNLFVPSSPAVDHAAVRAYGARLEPEATRRGSELGEPRWSDDGWDAKLDVVLAARPAVVSFTFGLPDAGVVARLRERQIRTWCTVTTPDEAVAGAYLDALVVQGAEAGGHRSSFEDVDGEPLALLPLLRLVARVTDLPLVAAGGIADGASVAAVLAAGARAAQIGTAFLLSPEAGTSEVHRRALARTGRTGLTRAFTGRTARGIENAFQRQHTAAAPIAYPWVHYLTAPLRAQARAAGDAEAVNLWAGQAYPLAVGESAADLVQRWSADARAALARASRMV
jgi:nitronate monooxygenase